MNAIVHDFKPINHDSQLTRQDREIANLEKKLVRAKARIADQAKTIRGLRQTVSREQAHATEMVRATGRFYRLYASASAPALRDACTCVPGRSDFITCREAFDYIARTQP